MERVYPLIVRLHGETDKQFRFSTWRVAVYSNQIHVDPGWAGRSIRPHDAST